MIESLVKHVVGCLLKGIGACIELRSDVRMEFETYLSVQCALSCFDERVHSGLYSQRNGETGEVEPPFLLAGLDNVRQGFCTLVSHHGAVFQLQYALEPKLE